MSPSVFPDRFKNVDPTEMPVQVELTPDEKKYIFGIIADMIDVVAEGRDPQEQDSRFGSGKFFWPKDLTKPVRTSISYEAQNFKLRSISLNFRRSSAEAKWCRAEMLVRPRNFPIGIFKMNLPSVAFNEYNLQRTSIEDRPHESIPIVNSFFYTVQHNNQKIKLKISCRQDVSDFNKKYPKSFHEVIIERDAPDCQA